MQDMTDPDRPARLYAIGDIHGRLDLLERAIAAIERDVAAHGANALTVTLGDYIDRGPNSRGVLDRLAANPFPTPYVPLRGNHESMLENFLADPRRGEVWRYQGGEQTLRSYGVPLKTLRAGYQEAAICLRAVLPPEQLRFLASLKLSLSHGRYFLCHAGVRPGIVLERQCDDDLLWIRDEFLDSTENFGKIVVHGHTPVAEPEIRPNRINIDTGAFASGRLTCVALERKGPRFLNV